MNRKGTLGFKIATCIKQRQRQLGIWLHFHTHSNKDWASAYRYKNPLATWGWSKRDVRSIVEFVTSSLWHSSRLLAPQVVISSLTLILIFTSFLVNFVIWVTSGLIVTVVVSLLQFEIHVVVFRVVSGSLSSSLVLHCVVRGVVCSWQVINMGGKCAVKSMTFLSLNMNILT